MNDIRFEYLPGKDSAAGIASELVGAGLVDSRDMSAIATNLQKLIEMRDQMKNITFALVLLFTTFNGLYKKTNLLIFQTSGCLNTETPDEKALIGYAQISISSE